MLKDCILYWKEDEKLNARKVCSASRWNTDKHNQEDKYGLNSKRIPQKTLHYFPLKPQL